MNINDDFYSILDQLKSELNCNYKKITYNEFSNNYSNFWLRISKYFYIYFEHRLSDNQKVINLYGFTSKKPLMLTTFLKNV